MSRYQDELIELAKKFDIQTDSKGKFHERVIILLNDYSEKLVIDILQYLVIEKQEGSQKIATLANQLSEALLKYAGYVSLKGYKQNKNELVTEECSLDDLKKELDRLVGLQNVKEEVNHLISYQRIQKIRKEKGLKIPNRTLHMAFTGNPGTGKTTVARIVGKMYKQLGLLSKGHFIEVSRTDLIAGYQGQTALKVKNVIEKAKGGVLFIDEAYSITENENSDSYGRECLTELTKALEDYRDDLVVIVAGYTKPMEQFFSSNPGLKSRFNYFIEFGNYIPDELLKILEFLCQKDDYRLSDNLKLKLINYFETSIQNDEKNFSNGRFVRNIYENLVMNQSVRLDQAKINDVEDLSLLRSCDFEK